MADLRVVKKLLKGKLAQARELARLRDENRVLRKERDGALAQEHYVGLQLVAAEAFVRELIADKEELSAKLSRTEPRPIPRYEAECVNCGAGDHPISVACCTSCFHPKGKPVEGP